MMHFGNLSINLTALLAIVPDSMGNLKIYMRGIEDPLLIGHVRDAEEHQAIQKWRQQTETKFQPTSAYVADVAYRALLDIQGLLERLETNIREPNDCEDTISELVELIATVTGKSAAEVMNDVCPRGEDEEAG